ncbi:hypothetical protein HMSSN139_15930 [Paenibacillus sp. HMSSN-139]|nr:hypothetical protein HMSSN139_15930 [Paenibacillus sp. HMSSN-139]
MQLAEFLPSQPSRLWHLAKQMNVNYAVSGLPWEEKTEKPWDLMPLIRMKQRYADFGLTLSVIESMPPSNKIKLGIPGRDEEIEIFQQFLVNMGAAGIPVLCYNFMAQFNWFRTSTTTRTRGGALVSSYDHSLMADAPLTEAGIVTEEQLWENLHYFLEKIVPVAESARVKLALHPDDPPITPIRGVSRICGTRRRCSGPSIWCRARTAALRCARGRWRRPERISRESFGISPISRSCSSSTSAT